MDKAWIVNTIEDIAQYGKQEKGTTRLAFTNEDRGARQYLINLMHEAGMSVRVDAIGNIIGRIEGADKNAPVVMTGSHLDTVPEGGNYDGVVGVVGGLAAIKRLKGRALTHTLELVIFTAEESSRFDFTTMGSKAMIGCANMNAWKKAKDRNGVTLAEAMRTFGLDINAIPSASRAHDKIKAFIELHIEQGGILEKERKNIGIVEVIAAPTRLKITVEGVAAHSGTTPMYQRHDALVSAAMIVLAVQEIAMEQAHLGTVGTVGVLKVYPGAMNVVPGCVEMWVDLRGVNYESIIESLQEIKDAVSTIAEGQETPISMDVFASDKPVELDKAITNVIEEACREQRVSYRRMNSGAGHDAMNMAAIAPTGMIFIPCKDGVSHNPDEYASPEDIMTGVDVLTAALYKLAK